MRILLLQAFASMFDEGLVKSVGVSMDIASVSNSDTRDRV